MSGHKRFLLPFIGIIFVLAVYSVYWIYMSQQIQRAVTDWVALQEADGYVIERESLRVSGFPYRFKVAAREARIEVPVSEGGWNADLAGISATALPYDLSHWIVEFAGPVRLDGFTAPDSEIELRADDARISLVYNRYGETERIGADLAAFEVVTLGGTPPAIRSIDRLLFNSVVQEDNRLHLRASVTGVAIAEGALDTRLLSAFGNTAETARLDLVVTQWVSLARGADALAWSAAGGEMEIVEAELQWGPAHVNGTGEITLDRLARPDGRLSLRIIDPDALADALVEGGLIPRENEQALRMAAMMAPRGPEGISLPFRIHESNLYLGPVRLGRINARLPTDPTD